MVPNSGAESDTDTYSAPVFCEKRFQPAPSSKPFLRLTMRSSGSLSLALRPFETIAIGAVTLRVASGPSKLPSALTVRFAMVAMIKSPGFDRDHPDGACTRGREPPSPEHRDGEPRTGLTAGGDPRPIEKRPGGWTIDRGGLLPPSFIGYWTGSEEHTSEI